MSNDSYKFVGVSMHCLDFRSSPSEVKFFKQRTFYECLIEVLAVNFWNTKNLQWFAFHIILNSHNIGFFHILCELAKPSPFNYQDSPWSPSQNCHFLMIYVFRSMQYQFKAFDHSFRIKESSQHDVAFKGSHDNVVFVESERRRSFNFLVVSSCCQTSKQASNKHKRQTMSLEVF